MKPLFSSDPQDMVEVLRMRLSKVLPALVKLFIPSTVSSPPVACVSDSFSFILSSLKTSSAAAVAKVVSPKRSDDDDRLSFSLCARPSSLAAIDQFEHTLRLICMSFHAHTETFVVILNTQDQFLRHKFSKVLSHQQFLLRLANFLFCCPFLYCLPGPPNWPNFANEIFFHIGNFLGLRNLPLRTFCLNFGFGKTFCC